MKIKNLSRDLFLEYAHTIGDLKSLKFSKESLELWDNYYSWEKYSPLCLIDDDEILCYLFYSISKNNEYLIIHRILTPLEFRKKNYALELISYFFHYFAKKDINRFKMNCVSSSISFYNKLGLNYWGVNTKGHYYCDFKMPKNDISEIPNIVKEAKVKDFSNEQFKIIYEKLKMNGKEFTSSELKVHEKCLLQMGERYRYKEIISSC